MDSKGLSQATVKLQTAELRSEKTEADSEIASILQLLARFGFVMALDIAISVVDARGTILDTNESFCSLWGYSRNELLGNNLRLIRSGIHEKSFWIGMLEKITNGSCWQGRICNRSKDGELHWVTSTILPLLDSNGIPGKFISIQTDITESVRAEALLTAGNQRNQLLASAVERSPDITVVTDLDGIVKYANTAANELDGSFGYDLRVGGLALMFVPDRMDWRLHRRIIDKVLAGEVFNGVIECCMDGDMILKEYGSKHSATPTMVLSLTASPLRADNGEICGILLVKRDITVDIGRQRAFEEISSALDSASEGAFILDAHTLKYVYANRRAVEHLGYGFLELKRLTPAQIDSKLTADMFRKIQAAYKSDPSQSFCFRSENRHRDGHLLPVEVNLQYIPDLGMSGRFLALVRDITEVLQAEKRLEAARDEAEASNRSKTEFLANMSHEIRTPMTAILGFTDLLERDPEFANDPQQVSEAIRTIRANAYHLLAIINDILDMSKIESGKMTVENISVSPVEMVEEIASLMRPRAVGKGIDLKVEYPAALPCHIHSDPTRLRQILINLIGNAVKFTEIGSVTVCCRYAEDTKQILFSIRDTGSGMTEVELDKICKFEAFSQADTSTTRKFGGTGLGLRISNCLATLLGGYLTATSKIGEGSTFTLVIANVEGMKECRICAKKTAESKMPPTPTPQLAPENSAKMLSGMKILLAEDGPDNQRLISFHLRKAGAEVVIAENGRIAMEMVESGEIAFDVVFMDMQMPELDGYEATKLLRSRNYDRPIIALTAHAMGGDRSKCLDAGCSGYATKPINRQELISIAANFRDLIHSEPAATIHGLSRALS